MTHSDISPNRISSNLSDLNLPPSRLLPQGSGKLSSSRAMHEVDPSSRSIRNRYKSAFTEIGLDGAADTTNCNMQNLSHTRPASRVRWRSQIDIREAEQQKEQDSELEISRAIPAATSHQYGSSATIVSRLSFLAVVLAIMIPVLHMSPLLQTGPAVLGAEAAPTTPMPGTHQNVESTRLLPRQGNAADTCLRWSQQSAVVNGTLYLYGGRAKGDSNQASNTWSKLCQPSSKISAHGFRQQLPHVGSEDRLANFFTHLRKSA